MIVRVPLASGLLTGKFSQNSQFAANDHRLYNRHGEAFDVGETFAGVDFATGIKAIEKLKSIIPADYTMAQFALKWILMQEAVSTVIVGGKTPQQVLENSQASEMSDLSSEAMKQVKEIYESMIKKEVHFRW